MNHGTIGTGSDSYQEVVGQAQGIHQYTKLVLYCESNPALIDMGGDGNNPIPLASGETKVIAITPTSKAVYAKNLNGGSNFSNLHVTAMG